MAIEKQNGAVTYAILSFGGFVGMAEYWSLRDVARSADTTPAPSENPAEPRSFARDEPSGWDDADSARAIYAYYGGFGVTPYW